jgi:hypothetical protein
MFHHRASCPIQSIGRVIEHSGRRLSSDSPDIGRTTSSIAGRSPSLPCRFCVLSLPSPAAFPSPKPRYQTTMRAARDVAGVCAAISRRARRLPVGPLIVAIVRRFPRYSLMHRPAFFSPSEVRLPASQGNERVSRRNIQLLVVSLSLMFCFKVRHPSHSRDSARQRSARDSSSVAARSSACRLAVRSP